MKKQIMLLSSALILLQGINSNAVPAKAPSKKQIDSLIVNAYTHVFGEQSDISQLSPNTITTIKNAVDETRAFVLANSKTLWMRDALLNKSLATIEDANKKLIDSVKISRSAPESNEVQDKMTHNFLEIITSMDKTIEKLDKKWYMGGKKNKSRQLLINLAKHIKDAAQHSIDARKTRAVNTKMPS